MSQNNSGGKIFCAKCKRPTKHLHLHDQAHGLTGTHMVGSERYECIICGRSLYHGSVGAEQLQFVLDKN